VKLSSLLAPRNILTGLAARTITDAVPEMLQRMVGAHPADSIDEITAAVLHRETPGSTAMALGVALPHTRLSNLHEFYLVLGVPQQPLEDKGLDGAPIEWVFLIVASDQKNTVLLQTMAAISTLVQDAGRLGAMKAASSPEALWQVIDGSAIQVKKGLFARDLMHEAPVVAREDMPLRELLDELFEHGAYEAPVCDEDGRIVGAITTEEIIDAGFPDYVSRLPDLSFLTDYEPFEQFFKREATTLVGEVLNRDPLRVDVEDPMIQVVFRLKKRKQHYAYVEEDGRFVGVIDRNDVISRILRI